MFVASTATVRDNASILITIGSVSTYEVNPQTESVVSGAQHTSINRIVGIVDETLYFTANYQLEDLRAHRPLPH